MGQRAGVSGPARNASQHDTGGVDRERGEQIPQFLNLSTSRPELKNRFPQLKAGVRKPKQVYFLSAPPWLR